MKILDRFFKNCIDNTNELHKDEPVCHADLAEFKALDETYRACELKIQLFINRSRCRNYAALLSLF